MGEIHRDADGGDRFRRGVTSYPAIGDHVAMIGREDLRLIYKATTNEAIEIGVLYHDNSISAVVDVNNLLTKHFAVLGSTGVGKSSGVAVILDAILTAKPDLRVFLLDVHNEFGRCFGERANVVTAGNLKLPFWMFNFEELADVLYGGRPGVEAELDILAEHIPAAKGMYLLHRLTADRSLMRRTEPRSTGFTVDTPAPYLLQDLVALIDERMGKLENRGARMHYHRLLARIEAVRGDARYAFMFENANVGGDTMADILALLFRLQPDGPSMTVMQVAGLPVEVVDSVVCVMCRLAFDFGFWSEGVSPLLFVCEEAHRFAAADRAIGFGPARRALLRIAKEGRKYGVHLGIVTQRPAELDSTLMSQCNTLFAMRMANDRDQALLASAVTDAGVDLLEFVPSLGTREVVAFGEGLPLPARLTFNALAPDRVPRSESFDHSAFGETLLSEKGFVKSVVDRWRGAATPKIAADEAVAGAEADPGFKTAAGSPIANRIEQIRSL